MPSDHDIEAFVEDGFVALRGALPRELADQGRKPPRAAPGCAPEDPAAWRQPAASAANAPARSGRPPRPPRGMRRSTGWRSKAARELGTVPLSLPAVLRSTTSSIRSIPTLSM